MKYLYVCVKGIFKLNYSLSTPTAALFAPYFLSSITSTPLATLDHLDKLASTVNLQKILKKAKNADESDVREAWIQKFHEEIKDD